MTHMQTVPLQNNIISVSFTNYCRLFTFMHDHTHMHSLTWHTTAIFLMVSFILFIINYYRRVPQKLVHRLQCDHLYSMT